MTALPKKKKYAPEEYLALEEQAEYRSEYENGAIVAMAGGSLNHAQITSNVNRFIGNKVTQNCRSLTTDVKVRVENYRKFYYPDVLVICGEPKFYQKRNDTVTNPILIVEVLSDSTEAKDRGEKFAAYQTLEFLQEYILVSQDKAKIEQFTRQNDGSWKYQATIGLKSAVKFTSIEVELTLDEIYQRIEFNQENL
ncbi:MAG: Uma2 family endonuclease [Pyrinomonadaceae bacterium]|nr:Uma2 family endonuclease [Pyrinomonadaceae bacterium]